MLSLLTQMIMSSLMQSGMEAVREKLTHTPRQITDLSYGQPHSELRGSFKATVSQRVSIVMVGLERGDWRICIPVTYGEGLRLRVQRGIYQVTAMFFEYESPKSPALVAMAVTEIMVMSNRPESFLLQGAAPSPSQLAEIRSAVSGEPPFLLPDQEIGELVPVSTPDVTGPDVTNDPELEIISVPMLQVPTDMEIVAWIGNHPADGEWEHTS